MPDTDRDPEPSRFPFRHGPFYANGCTVEGPQQRDWLEIFMDAGGDLVLLVIDVPGGPNGSSELGAEMLRETRAELFRQIPLHRAAAGLELALAAQAGLAAGLLIMRFSERDAKVELLNAGMPAVASAGPGQPLMLYPALSGPVGARVGEVHPYELLPLVWGVTWLGTSAGLLVEGQHEPEVAELSRKLDLAGLGAALSAARPGQLYEELRAVLGRDHLPQRDASAVLVSLNVSRERN